MSCDFATPSHGCTRGGCAHHLKPCPFSDDASAADGCNYFAERSAARAARELEVEWQAAQLAEAKAEREALRTATPEEMPPTIDGHRVLRLLRFKAVGAPPGAQVSQTGYDIVCPYCRAKVFAYRWSLWGRGKRCTCGVLLVPGAAVDDKGLFPREVPQ